MNKTRHSRQLKTTDLVWSSSQRQAISRLCTMMWVWWQYRSKAKNQNSSHASVKQKRTGRRSTFPTHLLIKDASPSPTSTQWREWSLNRLQSLTSPSSKSRSKFQLTWTKRSQSLKLMRLRRLINWSQGTMMTRGNLSSTLTWMWPTLACRGLLCTKVTLLNPWFKISSRDVQSTSLWSKS